MLLQALGDTAVKRIDLSYNMITNSGSAHVADYLKVMVVGLSCSLIASLLSSVSLNAACWEQCGGAGPGLQ